MPGSDIDTELLVFYPMKIVDLKANAKPAQVVVLDETNCPAEILGT